MRCFESAQGYVADVRRRRGEPDPSTATIEYMLVYEDGRTARQSYAPEDYLGVKLAQLCVDGAERAERIYGWWIEDPTPLVRQWLRGMMLHSLLCAVSQCGLDLIADGPTDDTGAGDIFSKYLQEVVDELSPWVVPGIVAQVWARIQMAGELSVMDDFGKLTETVSE